MGQASRMTGALAVCVALLLAAALALPAAGAAAPVPLAQFGSSGAGAGQLKSPRAVAVDGSGNVYVGDFTNYRIDVFSPSGAFLRAFGRNVIPANAETGFEVCTTATTCQAGEQSGFVGGLNNPRGLAFDGAGNLYVADSFNNRISVFNVSGTPSFVRAFGRNVINGGATNVFEVCTTVTGCKAGDAGGNVPGQLDEPGAVTLDASGNVYVADSANDRISVFSAAGPSFTRSFGWDVTPPDDMSGFETCTTGTGCISADLGGGAGQLHDPEDLAIDGSGNLYVADAFNNRISVFGSPATAPSFLRAFGGDVVPGPPAGFEVCTTTCQVGSPSSGAGELNIPLGLARDGSGNLYVGDESNHRISVFNGTPSFVRAFGFGVDTGAGAFQVCTTASGCQIGTGGAAAGQLNFPEGVALDCRGAVWVADTFNNRVQRFGEPGTPLPPCTMGQPTPPAAKCGGKKATIVGTAGKDVRSGTAKADVIALLGGNDTARGLAGNDILCGGAGRDKLIGGGGRDRLVGGGGRDVCKGGPKRDRAASCEVRRTI
jgi:DNA-binding beta-propeller fold protein YncE